MCSVGRIVVDIFLILGVVIIIIRLGFVGFLISIGNDIVRFVEV